MGNHIKLSAIDTSFLKVAYVLSVQNFFEDVVQIEVIVNKCGTT